MKNISSENSILIFAGTTEGRILAEYASDLGIPCYVSTATEYGESIIHDIEGIIPLCGRMNEEQISCFIQEHKIRTVIDATHPFAVKVSENIRRACLKNKINYIRCLRKQENYITGNGIVRKNRNQKMICFSSIDEAVDYLQGTTGNILITTGSKELYKYTKIKNYKKRCFARILSTYPSVEISVKLGFEGKNLIAMQGPFSEEMNCALIRHVNASYFVTKESGRAGGFEDKLSAARKTGITLVVIVRPDETGYSLDEVRMMLQNFQISVIEERH